MVMETALATVLIELRGMVLATREWLTMVSSI